MLLAVEKRITSPLLEPDSIEKIMEIDSHMGCSMSGLTADARTLIDHARIETQNHRFTYDAPMTVEATTQSICDLALGFGEGGKNSMSRPYGVALLLAGCDDLEGPVLYHTDPSGTFVRFKAKAIGSGSEGAQTNLQEALADGTDSMTIEGAETLALQTLKQVMEEKINSTNVEIACVTKAKGFYIYSTEQVEALLTRL